MISNAVLGSPRPRAARPSISAVVPMHDEAEAAAAFLPALRDALAALTDRYEIVVVDDGSRDATRDVVLAAPAECCVHYLELSRNFGKEAALTAGLAAARGEVVVLLDGDGQHPVEVIGTMLQRWREGWDVAYGVRSGRGDESLRKRTGAGLFYRLMAWGAPIEIPAGAGDFRLLDRHVVEALKRLPERDRFMKGLYAWVGFRSVAVPYDVQPRLAGTSRFSALALTRLALSGLTSFTTLPLRLVSAMGLLVSTAAVLYGLWVIVEHFVYAHQVPGYPTIVTSIMFFAGVQLLSVGIIGEYLGRVYDEVKRRPVYLVAASVDRSPLAPCEPAPACDPAEPV